MNNLENMPNNQKSQDPGEGKFSLTEAEKKKLKAEGLSEEEIAKKEEQMEGANKEMAEKKAEELSQKCAEQKIENFPYSEWGEADLDNHIEKVDTTVEKIKNLMGSGNLEEETEEKMKALLEETSKENEKLKRVRQEIKAGKIIRSENKKIEALNRTINSIASWSTDDFETQISNIDKALDKLEKLSYGKHLKETGEKIEELKDEFKKAKSKIENIGSKLGKLKELKKNEDDAVNG